MYTVDYFIEKFEKILEKKWTTGEITRGFLWNKRHCALGHCEDANMSKYFVVGDTEVGSLILLFAEYLDIPVYFVNDGIPIYNADHSIRLFNGHTPKQRILNALYKIKELIAKEEREKTKVEETKIEFIESAIIPTETKIGASV